MLVGLLIDLRETTVVDWCVARDPGLPDRRGEVSRAGFEILNPVLGGVWLTREWTVEAFEAFSFPWTWPLWLKNDPRRGVADGGRFLRSPGCAEEGEFTYMRAFGREFVKVVDLQSMPASLEDGRVRRVELEKHHVLTYAQGSTVRTLQSPEQERFVLVAETFARTGPPIVPTGWTLNEHTLQQPVEVALTEQVSVLRLSNEDSFQGPIPSDVWAQIAGEPQ